MQYNHKLLEAEVVAVYNKLIVDAKLDNGKIIPTFCSSPNVVDMCKPKTKLLLKKTSRPKRIVKYNISFIKTPEGMVFVNPRYRYQLFEEAFKKGILTDLAEYKHCRRLNEKDNVKGLDFELTSGEGKKAVVFVAPIYKKQNGMAVFPQSTNFFEMKMIDEMQKRRLQGFETYVLMIAQREDCVAAKFAWNFDAQAAAMFFEAAKNGLNFLCYGCKVDKNNIEINRKMEILY